MEDGTARLAGEFLRCGTNAVVFQCAWAAARVYGCMNGVKGLRLCRISIYLERPVRTARSTKRTLTEFSNAPFATCYLFLLVLGTKHERLAATVGSQ